MKKLSYADFARQVAQSRLKPRKCHPTHWQITGGARRVNCWPNTKARGFVMAADGETGQPGTVAEAIRLAVPPVMVDCTFHNVQPPREEPKDGHVGLIRRFWRWIW